MALYWPEHKVALDIVDDPDRRPFAGGDGYTVIKVTMADLGDPVPRARVMSRLRALLKPGEVDDEKALSYVPFPNDSLGGSEGPDPLGEDPVEIVACSEEEGARMADSVRMRGSTVKGVSVWAGPVPPDSFTYYAPGVRMCTAEYFFLRKANQLPLPEAVRLGNELCGKFRTRVTEGCAPIDSYTFMRVPRTDRDYIGNYLSKVADTKEGKRALEVLGLVVDGAASPMASYLHTMLTLPPASTAATASGTLRPPGSSGSRTPSCPTPAGPTWPMTCAGSASGWPCSTPATPCPVPMTSRRSRPTACGLSA